MLIAKQRLNPGTDAATFCRLALDARRIQVVAISPEIAAASVSIALPHGDPADRLIAATALAVDAPLITCDEKLRASEAIKTLW